MKLLVILCIFQILKSFSLKLLTEIIHISWLIFNYYFFTNKCVTTTVPLCTFILTSFGSLLCILITRDVGSHNLNHSSAYQTEAHSVASLCKVCFLNWLWLTLLSGQHNTIKMGKIIHGVEGRSTLMLKIIKCISNYTLAPHDIPIASCYLGLSKENPGTRKAAD